MSKGETTPVRPNCSLPEVGDEVHDAEIDYSGVVTDIYRGNLVLRPVLRSGPTWLVPKDEAASRLTVSTRREDRQW